MNHTRMLLLLALISVSAAVVFPNTMNTNNYRDDGSRAWVNAFGDIMGPNNANTRLVYDLWQYTTTATNNMGSLYKNGPENFNAAYGLYKDGVMFWDRYRGTCLYTDKFIYDMDFKLEVKEQYKKTSYSSYTLKNNMLDGVWVSLSQKDIFRFEAVYCYMGQELSNTSAYWLDAYYLNHDDVSFQGAPWTDTVFSIMGGALDLDFLKKFNNDIIKFNTMRLSWGGTSLLDIFAKSDVFNGSPLLSTQASTNQIFTMDFIYLSIKPYRSSDGRNFSAFFGGSVEFGQLSSSNAAVPLDIISLGAQNCVYSNDISGRMYVRIDEGATYYIKIPISGLATTNKIKINLLLANSFYVQESMDAGNILNLYYFQPYESVNPGGTPWYYKNEQCAYPQDIKLSSARHDIRDFSNLKEYSFYYGTASAVHSFGLEGEVDLLGVKVTGGFFGNLRIFQAPMVYADRSYNLSYAFYAEAVKKIGDLSLNAAVYRHNPDYLTDFVYMKRTNMYNTNQIGHAWTVLDNDNDDNYSPYQRLFDGGTETYEARVRLDDINRNLFPDYFEDFLMFKNFPDIFREGDDLNNNTYVDANEDDLLADYRYRENLEGARINASYMLIKGLMVTLDARYEDITSSPDDISMLIQPKLTYEYKEKDTLEVLAKIAYKRVQDEIVNDVPSEQARYVGGGSGGADSLLYRDSDVFEVYLNAIINPMKDVVGTTISHIEMNIRHHDNNRVAIRQGILFQLLYKPPVNLMFQKTPILDVFFKNMTLETGCMVQLVDQYFMPSYMSLTYNDRRLAGMYKFALALSKQTILYHGMQYFNVSSAYDKNAAYEKVTAIVEMDMVIKDFVIILGGMNEGYNYPSATAKNGNNLSIYLRLVSRT